MFCSDFVFFFKQKTAYEMRISDWSSDVCSSDLVRRVAGQVAGRVRNAVRLLRLPAERTVARDTTGHRHRPAQQGLDPRAGDQVHARQFRRKQNPSDRRSRTLHRVARAGAGLQDRRAEDPVSRSEEHTSELQSLMRTSYAVFGLKKKKTNK